ncbi:MAG: NAD-dependent epimerase/dehydratase family protein [Leptospiraceae bacterium]|nr:NAD-dependent epimerase/dehydratase family protein [Leptospiraceae bacterium]
MPKIKILICGGSGFIGRNLIDFFSAQDQYEVHATYTTRNLENIKNIRSYQIDLTNAEEINKIIKGKDVIIQAAAVTSGMKDILEKPYIHTTDNAIMNSLLLRSAYENHIKHFIFFSCSIMYKNSDLLQNETDFFNYSEILPNYFAAAWTKLYIEKMCEFYSSLGRTKHTVFRHSNIYGPYDKFDLERSHMFGANVTKVMKTENDNISIWGSGEEKKDLLFVDDLMRAVQASLKKQKSAFGLYNIGSGEGVSVKDIVEKIIHLSGKKLEILCEPTKPSLKANIILDIGKAKRELNWSPQVTLEEGIQLTLNWYRKKYLA